MVEANHLYCTYSHAYRHEPHDGQYYKGISGWNIKMQYLVVASLTGFHCDLRIVNHRFGGCC